MKRLLGLLAAIAAVATGCASPGPPELTVYADGTAIEVTPGAYCSPVMTDCTKDDAAQGKLAIRPGRPVQLSVPTEVSEAPWRVIVQSADAEGKPLPPRARYFGPGKAPAYTAYPQRPGERLLVIEVWQLSAVITPDGQRPVRGVWSVQLTPR